MIEFRNKIENVCTEGKMFAGWICVDATADFFLSHCIIVENISNRLTCIQHACLPQTVLDRYHLHSMTLCLYLM